MLKIQEIRELIRLIDQSNIDEFLFEQDGTKVKMKKKVEHETGTSGSTAYQMIEVKPEPVQSIIEESVSTNIPAGTEPVAAKDDSKQVGANDMADLHQITSPMVGTFYTSPSPEAGPYVKIGDKVTKDTVVCIVEAMKLFNEIEAEVDGEIVEILVENGQLVEYGQPLFAVKTK